MTVDKLIMEHKNRHPNSHFFDKNTLRFFCERKSEMKVLEENKMVQGKSCYVLSTLQRNAPMGPQRAYHYFDDENFEEIRED